jgi:hypothetical protein
MLNKTANPANLNCCFMTSPLIGRYTAEIHANYNPSFET